MKRIGLILIILIIAFSSGCTDNSQSKIVEKGDNVSVNYIGKLDNGTVFDTSLVDVAKEAGLYDANSTRTYEPMSFVVGTGQMISGFDNGVLNMTVGEEKTLKLSPDEAYGEYNQEYLVPVPRSDLENASHQSQRFFKRDCLRRRQIRRCGTVHECRSCGRLSSFLDHVQGAD
ncbi:MAG: hypothetical protein HGA25_10720, partial [Clostridiales bacterium]|nr:hypothetical protein [Clostridiales bacterium]